MKTLQEIIDRHDYVRVNQALKERAYELAAKIRAKFEELYPIWDVRRDDIPQYAVKVGARWYVSRYNIYRDNFERYSDGTTLNVLTNGMEVRWTLEDNEYSTNTPASVFVQFLNDANTIVQELDKAESELVAESESALANSSNL